MRGHGDKLEVTGREWKGSRVICVIKFWYLGFALLLPVLTYLANQKKKAQINKPEEVQGDGFSQQSRTGQTPVLRITNQEKQRGHQKQELGLVGGGREW